MKEKIYPVNFDMEIEFVVGPNLQVPCTPILIQTQRVIGFDCIKPSEALKAIMFDPIPIVLETNGLYFSTREVNYWKADLLNAEGSHILCLVLKSDIDEESREKVISIVNHIHGNRTLMDRKSLFNIVENNINFQNQIRSVYGIDGNLFHRENGLSSLLGANGYAKPPQARKSRSKIEKNAAKKTLFKAKYEPEKAPNLNQNHLSNVDPIPEDCLDSSISQPIGDNANNFSQEYMEGLKEYWNDFAIKHDEILTFDEIINTFSEESRQQATMVLKGLIERESPATVWNITSAALKKISKELPNEEN